MYKRRATRIVREVYGRYNYKRDVVILYINNRHFTTINILHLDRHKLLYIFSNLLKWIDTLSKHPRHSEISTKIIMLNSEL